MRAARFHRGVVTSEAFAAFIKQDRKAAENLIGVAQTTRAEYKGIDRIRYWQNSKMPQEPRDTRPERTEDHHMVRWIVRQAHAVCAQARA